MPINHSLLECIYRLLDLFSHSKYIQINIFVRLIQLRMNASNLFIKDNNFIVYINKSRHVINSRHFSVISTIFITQCFSTSSIRLLIEKEFSNTITITGVPITYTVFPAIFQIHIENNFIKQALTFSLI